MRAAVAVLPHSSRRGRQKGPIAPSVSHCPGEGLNLSRFVPHPVASARASAAVFEAVSARPSRGLGQLDSFIALAGAPLARACAAAPERLLKDAASTNSLSAGRANMTGSRHDGYLAAPRSSVSRRRFLQAAAATVGGAALATTRTASGQRVALPPPEASGIEHRLAVMMENR